ncbi:MAG: hypothetical protein IK058_03200 [Bacteroidales bacterium]|nr:hypothetical protein [Bacteroidales bacterium]
MTTAEKYRRILSNHLPAQVVDTVYSYLDRHKVHFHITRGRVSKLGDYRWPQGERTYHEISINGDLNPYLFLWVFLHEAAHLETHLKHDNVQPHGHEWQREYALLITSYAAFFPPEVQPLLARYVRRIPLNRSILRQIETLLHRYDPGYSDEEHLTLDHLPAGSRFRLKAKPDMLLESVGRRRTRWLCRDTTTGRQYTVAATAEVNTEH